jgi:MFS transporter, MHS family, proline/betaine transporter
MVVVTPFGMLSDRVGRKPVLVGSSAALAAGAVPLMHLAAAGSAGAAVTASILLALPIGAFMGAAAAAIPESFTTRRRYVGMSLAFGLSSAAFGGTAPYLSTYTTGELANPVAPGYLLVAFAVVSLIAALTLRETAHRSLAEL